MMTLLPFFIGLTIGLQVDGSASTQLANATVVTTARFELRSDPRVALHHFLIDWASAEAGEWPPYALPLAEREDWQCGLDAKARRTWAASVEGYAAAVGRSLVFDGGLIAVRDWAAGVAGRDAIPLEERLLADALRAALPIYTQHWWPAHDASNSAWIESVIPTLAAVEEQMIGRVEAAYGGRWPRAPIPIDVMVYANDVGAYSTGGRLTIASAHRGNQMPQAIEMIFHEASHVDPLEIPLRTALDDAFAAAGREAPNRFWHDVIFFTSGEVTRLVLSEHGQPGYQHYGSFGAYRRGERWTVELPALEQHWRPFLESGSRESVARQTAMGTLADALVDLVGRAGGVGPVDPPSLPRYAH